MDNFWAAFGGGAAGSVFTLLGVLLVDALQRWRLRPQLRIMLEFGYLVPGVNRIGYRIWNRDPSRPPPDGNAIISFHALNPSPFPLEITSYGLATKRRKDGRLFVNPDFYGDQPPKLLKQGESFTQTAPVTQLGLIEGKGWLQIEYVWFSTRSGHKFQSRISRQEKDRVIKFLEMQRLKAGQDSKSN